MRGSLLRFIKRCQPLWRLGFALGLICINVSLPGCSQPDNVVSSVHTLNQRIASTLNTPPATLNYTPRPEPMPAVRELKPTGEPAGMSFLISLQLGHCSAGQLIAERNSSLGRLEDGLMRYQDDLALLTALKSCAEHSDSAPIKTELEQAIADKRQQLAYDKAQGFATDKALRHALTVSNTPLSVISDSRFEPPLNALKHLTEWLKQPTADAQLANWRQQLAQSDYLPRLMRSTIEMRLKLQQLQQQLPSLTQAAGCNAKGVPERASILQNVFMQFFISDVQVTLAALTTQYQQLKPVLENLADQTPQTALKQYLTELSLQGEQLTETSKAFVQPWQQLFADCGFTPGAD